MKKQKQAKSPLAKFMQAQLEAKKAGGKFGVLGKELTKNYTQEEYVPPEVKAEEKKTGKTK